MKTLWLALPLLGLASLVSGCSVPLKAKAPVERPALDIPPPPPRVIEPAPAPDVPPEPVPELPPAPAPAKPNANNNRPAQPRPNNPTAAAETKPEAKPDTAVTDSAPAPPATPPSVPQLRTPQTADGSEAEKNVRSTLDRAKSVLNTVNFNPLSNERKKAYNDAKAFIQQAEEAIKQGNYVFAQGVATKAETLAHELAGR
jgi:hypothetical protein